MPNEKGKRRGKDRKKRERKVCCGHSSFRRSILQKPTKGRGGEISKKKKEKKSRAGIFSGIGRRFQERGIQGGEEGENLYFAPHYFVNRGGPQDKKEGKKSGKRRKKREKKTLPSQRYTDSGRRLCRSRGLKEKRKEITGGKKRKERREGRALLSSEII